MGMIYRQARNQADDDRELGGLRKGDRGSDMEERIYGGRQ